MTDIIKTAMDAMSAAAGVPAQDRVVEHMIETLATVRDSQNVVGYSIVVATIDDDGMIETVHAGASITHAVPMIIEAMDKLKENFKR